MEIWLSPAVSTRDSIIDNGWYKTPCYNLFITYSDLQFVFFSLKNHHFSNKNKEIQPCKACNTTQCCSTDIMLTWRAIITPRMITSPHPNSGWLGWAMVLGIFKCRGVLLLLHIVGQGTGRVGYIFYIFHLSSLSNVLSFGRWLNITEILWFRLLNPNGSCQLLSTG